MLSLFGFIFSIGLAFEIVRIIILVFEIIKDLFERVSLYHCDSWKLYIKLQTVPFVFLQIIIIIEIIFIELFGGESKHLRWEA